MKTLTDIGYLPPQAVEIETVVLGALLISPEAVFEVADLLTAESFYKDENQKIFQSIIDLERQNKKIDILTVTEQLRKNKHLDEVGGALYIAQLTERIASASHIRQHSLIVAEKYLKRQLISIGAELQKQSYDESIDIADSLEYADKSLTELTIGKSAENAISVGNSMNQVIDELEKIQNKDSAITGIPSGLTTLDRITGGWQNSDLVILAARPSMGKSAIMLKWGKEAASMGFPVLLFSLEMSHKQLSKRLLAGEIEAEPRTLNSKLPNYLWDSISTHLGKFSDMPLYMDDRSGLTIWDVKATARRMVRKYGIKLIILDYLQLMVHKDKSQNREQEISTISRGLKGIAKELDIPVIALSQLNRQVETRGGFKRPMLADLRESGAIEQDADIVIFLNRPKKYGFDEFDDKESTSTTCYQGNTAYEVAELIIAKHRNGSTCMMKITHNEEMTAIEDYHRPIEEPELRNYYEKEVENEF
ncbi:MAG: replicative DNA helicase [Candidatus Atribacteria bacterium]|nr:replicative DNA helicase [Candidatus Atribacteria bacterium]